jgi:transposase
MSRKRRRNGCVFLRSEPLALRTSFLAIDVLRDVSILACAFSAILYHQYRSVRESMDGMKPPSTLFRPKTMNKSKSRFKSETVRYEKSLSMINPHAAGLDLHREKIWACYSDGPDSDASVRTFGTVTAELRRLVEWLKASGVETVAMESTGVYWVPVYAMLEDAGLKPVLVNAREVKSVKGRPKTDRIDCMWICRLHSYGLLRGSFVPPTNVTALKNLCDCREKVIHESSRAIQRMQKALQRMNCRLDNAVSDIMGESGSRIIRAILAGERDPVKLANLANFRVEKKKSEIARDLEGDFRPELVQVLEEWHEHYLFYERRLAKINRKIYAMLEMFPKKADAKNLPPRPANYREDNMNFNRPFRPLMFEIFGTDLTQLAGVGPSVILSFLATVGPDVSAWATENHFVSWLGLAPNPQSSGDYCKKGKTKRVKNLLACNLKTAGMTVQRTDSFLGAFHRRLKIRVGPAKAKNASARKIAIILYRLVKYGNQAIKFSAEQYEHLYKERKLANLTRQARQMGFSLIPEHAANE